MSGESREAILEALWALVRGAGATVPAIEDQPALMGLEDVLADARGFDGSPSSLSEVAGVVVLRLEEAADSLESDYSSNHIPNLAKAARAALGLKGELAGRPFKAVKGRKGRAEAVAAWLGKKDLGSIEKVRQDGTSPLGALIDAITEVLYRNQNAYRLNEKRRAQRARRPPLESAMGLQWLSRYEDYARMSVSISGLCNDIELALEYLRKDQEVHADVRIRKALYYFSAYLFDLERFYFEHGLLWIFPDADAEQAISDATWFVRKYAQLGEINESMLRLAFAANTELALFTHAMYSEPYFQPIIRAWRDAVLSCECSDLKRPRRSCQLHAMLQWGRFFMDKLEEQWRILTDWYEPADETSAIETARRARPGFPTLPPAPVDAES